jgi:hypothetical protein
VRRFVGGYLATDQDDATGSVSRPESIQVALAKTPFFLRVQALAKKVLGAGRLLSSLKTRRSKRPEMQFFGTARTREEWRDGR